MTFVIQFAVVYMRSSTSESEINCHLLLAETKAVTVTVPKLDLCG